MGTDVGYERVATGTDEDEVVVGIDYTARYGIVSAMTENDDDDEPTVRPWIDVGPALGLGIATPTNRPAELLGHAWLGVWADVRLWSSKSYPILRMEVQTDGYSSDLRGGVQFMIGLGYASEPTDDPFIDRDD